MKTLALVKYIIDNQPSIKKHVNQHYINLLRENFELIKNKYKDITEFYEQVENILLYFKMEIKEIEFTEYSSEVIYIEICFTEKNSKSTYCLTFKKCSPVDKIKYGIYLGYAEDVLATQIDANKLDIEIEKYVSHDFEVYKVPN